MLILLNNARKYTPPGGRVTLSLCRAGTEARLIVADSGIGIVPTDLPRIFDRFYRADAARGAGGSGLGLAIARWIIEQRGGRIEAESALGRGSTFTVSLPALPAPSPLHHGDTEARRER